MADVQALVSSGDGRAWPQRVRQSEGSGVERGISGSETSVGSAKLGQTGAEKGRGAAEHLQRDASIGMLGTKGR